MHFPGQRLETRRRDSFLKKFFSWPRAANDDNLLATLLASLSIPLIFSFAVRRKEVLSLGVIPTT